MSNYQQFLKGGKEEKKKEKIIKGIKSVFSRVEGRSEVSKMKEPNTLDGKREPPGHSIVKMPKCGQCCVDPGWP